LRKSWLPCRSSDTWMMVGVCLRPLAFVLIVTGLFCRFAADTEVPAAELDAEADAAAATEAPALDQHPAPPTPSRPPATTISAAPVANSAAASAGLKNTLAIASAK